MTWYQIEIVEYVDGLPDRKFTATIDRRKVKDLRNFLKKGVMP